MIDIKQIRKNPEKFKKAAKDKNYDVDIDHLLNIDTALLDNKNELQYIATEKNKLGKSIPTLSGDEKANAIGKLSIHKKNEVKLQDEIKKLQP